MNIYHKLQMIININCTILDMVQNFMKLYHVTCHLKPTDIPPFIIFINDKRYSSINTSKYKFTPNNFNYKDDYVIILETEIFKIKEIDFGEDNDIHFLKDVKVPHFVYSSYHNLQIESFNVCRNITYLECEIFELKKEYYIDFDIKNEKATNNKIQAFFELNWKERVNLITVIKSDNFKKCKENFNAFNFEIYKTFNLILGKIYIFLINSQNRKVYGFKPEHFVKEGLLIISKNNKSLLSGFRAKKVSDFIINQK